MLNTRLAKTKSQYLTPSAAAELSAHKKEFLLMNKNTLLGFYPNLSDRWVKSLVVGAMVVGLVGCGGSSSEPLSNSSTSNPSTSNPSTSNPSISGVANKGILKKANVEVFERVNSLWVSRGTATTADDGSYTAELKDLKDGVIKVEVSVDDNTLMICDVPSGCPSGDGTSTIDFGTDVAVDGSLFLKSIVLPKATKAHVTALTHIASGKIEASAIDEKSIKTAHQEVANSFGLSSIFGIKPFDVSKAVPDGATADQQQMAIAIAAVAETMAAYNADGDGTGVVSAKDFAAALQAMREEFKGGGFSLESDVKLGIGMSLLERVIDVKKDLAEGTDDVSKNFRTKGGWETTELATALATASDESVALKETFAELKAAYGTGKKYTPPTPSYEHQSEVVRAKKIVSDMRTIVASLDNTRDLYVNPFQTKIELAQHVMSPKAVNHQQWIGIALAAMMKDVSSTPETKDISLKNGDHTVTGAITYSENDAQATFTLKADATETNPKMELTSVVKGLGLSDLAAQLKGTSISTEVESLGFNVTGTIADKDGAVVTTLLDVSLGLVLKAPQSVNEAPNVKEMTIKGSMRIALAADGTRPKTQWDGEMSATVVTNTNYVVGGTNINSKYSVNVKDLVLGGKIISGSQFMDARIQATALDTVANPLDELVYDGSETTNNFAAGGLHISLDSAFTGFPNTDLLMSVNRLKANEAYVIASINQKDKNRKIKMTFNFTDVLTKRTLKDVLVSTNDGSTLTLSESEGTNGSVVGNVTVDNAIVGTIVGGRINYIDNTFESF